MPCVLPDLPMVKPVAAESTVKLDEKVCAFAKDVPNGWAYTWPVVLDAAGAEKSSVLPVRYTSELDAVTKPPTRLPT